jgi:ABC-type phosphate transport system substrate-binding protein
MNLKRIFLSTIILTFFVCASYAQVAVIANQSVSDAVADAGTLGSIYDLSKDRWSNNNRIVVVDLTADGDVRQKFYGFIGKNPAELRREWLRKQLTGEGRAPETAASDAEVISKVAATPGAIGYVSQGSVTGAVKVLHIIR